MLLRILLFLLRRFAPREGYPAWGTILAALTCLAAAFTEANWVAGGLVAVLPLWLAPICAASLARRPFGWRLGSFLLAIWGVEFAFAVAGRILPTLGWFLQALAEIPSWLGGLLSFRLDPFPLMPLARLVAMRSMLFLSHLQRWAQDVVAGGAAQDDAVFLLFALLLAWGVGAWAGWVLVRRYDAWLALAPAGVLLAIEVFFADVGIFWLALFLALLLLSAVAIGQVGRERAWQRVGVDFSEEIRLDLAFTGSFLSVGVVVVALVLPGFSYRTTVELFWKVFAEPWRGVERAGQRLFPGLGRQAHSPLGDGTLLAGGVGLPRVHLLGGSPELSKRRALRVRLRESPEGLQGVWGLYWRGLTYERYSGRGWENEPLRGVALAPGEPWTAVRLPGRRELWQTVEAAAGGESVLFAAPEPFAADVSVQALRRDADDLLALALGRKTSRYTVVSLVPAMSEEALRLADEVYPVAVKERYLQLPPLPERVMRLVRALTAEAPTPYDRARALESYLRSYPYTLDVPLPPPEQDVVDWFLFDLRKGYCDYYATAFVVMARAVGLPARLAVGYVAGSYDAQAKLYTVVEADAHSWPEVYFPRYGWLPFEPTGGRAALTRGAQLPPAVSEWPEMPLGEGMPGLSELASLGAAQKAREAAWRAWGIGVVCALAALGIALGWLRRRRCRLTPGEAVEALWGRVVRWGAWLGRAPRASETPREYAMVLAVHWPAAQEMPVHEVRRLAEAYTALRYGRVEPSEPERREAEMLWRRLRKWRWRGLARRLSPFGKGGDGRVIL